MKFLKRAVEKWAKPLIEDHFNKKIKPRIAARKILENPFLVGKRLMPLEKNKGFYVVPKTPAPCEMGPDGLAIPPQEYWEGYGKTPEQYLGFGRDHVKTMQEILQADGASLTSMKHVLDFGCAAGRMLRFIPDAGEGSERWGVDLKAETINWCQQYLSPKMLFAPCTTLPHLPFEDNSFDLVYAGSVFTHISDLPDTWFLELRRIVKKGGYLYLTVFDKQAVTALLTEHKDREDLDMRWFVDMLQRFEADTGALSSDYATFSFEGGSWGGFPVPQVGYDTESLSARWGAMARVASVNPGAYNYQTAMLLQKR